MELLGAGMQAVEPIDGMGVAVVLTDIVTPTKARGRIAGIPGGPDNRSSLGDSVLIACQDKYSLEVDTEHHWLGKVATGSGIGVAGSRPFLKEQRWRRPCRLITRR